MSTATREIVFISKATPGDDYFALQLAPKLEAAGYRVFADVISQRAGDSWRQRLTDTLRDQAVKILLCCKDSTLQRTGVQEEIGIASHVMGVTGDANSDEGSQVFQTDRGHPSDLMAAAPDLTVDLLWGVHFCLWCCIKRSTICH